MESAPDADHVVGDAELAGESAFMGSCQALGRLVVLGGNQKSGGELIGPARRASDGVTL